MINLCSGHVNLGREATDRTPSSSMPQTWNSFLFNALQFSIYPPTTQKTGSNLSHFFFFLNPYWWNSDWERLRNWERDKWCCHYEGDDVVTYHLFVLDGIREYVHINFSIKHSKSVNLIIELFFLTLKKKGKWIHWVLGS